MILPDAALLREKAEALVNVTMFAASKGWLPATSGNLSIRVSEKPLLFLITASGNDKTKITANDLVLVDEHSRSVETDANRPSAETVIHAEMYKSTACGSVLHVHTVYNNVVSELYAQRQSVPLHNMELIKGLDIWDEGAAIEVPIVENYADIPRIAAEAASRLDRNVPGVLIRNHGIYAWGTDVFEARRHLEAFEFIFHYLCVYRSCTK